MGGIVAALLVAGVVVGVIVRQRSHDDAHSVEHYHRKLHTLEEIRAHPSTAGGPANGNGTGTGDGASKSDGSANASDTESGAPAAGHAGHAGNAAYPTSALRIPGSSAVRLTEPSKAAGAVAPAPSLPRPSPLADTSEPVLFDDSGPESTPSTFMRGKDRAMEAINHRPRRLGGPLAAVAAVTVLVIILIVTGLHSNAPASHSGHRAGTATTVQSHAHAHAPVAHAHRPAATTTTTTVPPVVSAPTSSSAQAATYSVGSADYTLALSATSGECWMQATDATTGAVLFSGTLFSGQSHTVSATGPVTVVTGAPSAFAATVNGVAVTLPQGYQAPLTLKFETPQGSG